MMDVVEECLEKERKLTAFFFIIFPLVMPRI
jgi:hypothetical protein